MHKHTQRLPTFHCGTKQRVIYMFEVNATGGGAAACSFLICIYVFTAQIYFPRIKKLGVEPAPCPVSPHSSPPVFPSTHSHPTPESWGSAVPKLTTCLQGQPEYLGESQPAESQSRGRPGLGLTSNETRTVGRLRWRWGRACSSCILQIRAIHHLYTQDGLFNIPRYPGHDCLNLGKCALQVCKRACLCVCGTTSGRGMHTFFFSDG